MADPGRIPGQIVIPTGMQVRLAWTLGTGKVVFNVLHGTVAAGFTATAAIAEAIRAGITTGGSWTAYAAFLPTSANLAFVDLKDIRNANLPIVASTGAATPGTSVSVPLPAGAALVVTERTAFAGRASRGRIYLPGLATNAQAAGGVLAAGVSTAAFNFVTLVSTTFTAQGITIALANPARQLYTGRRGAIHPARAASMVPVTSFQQRQNFFNSQRRRSQVA